MQLTKTAIFVLAACCSLVASEPEKTGAGFAVLYEAKLQRENEQLSCIDVKEKSLNRAADDLLKNKAQDKYGIATTDTMTVEQIITALSVKGTAACRLVKAHEKDKRAIKKGIKAEKLYHLANIKFYEEGLAIEKEFFQLS